MQILGLALYYGGFALMTIIGVITYRSSGKSQKTDRFNLVLFCGAITVVHTGVAIRYDNSWTYLPFYLLTIGSLLGIRWWIGRNPGRYDNVKEEAHDDE